jgi:hypothetical protein
MREILIAEPALNADMYNDWSCCRYPEYKDLTIFFNANRNINPKTHPKAVDLSSGRGAVAHFLTLRGWKPENILCVDICYTDKPFITGASWMYMDLRALMHAILDREEIPEKITKLHKTFDLVTHVGGYFMQHEEEIINEYFVRDDGYIYGVGLASR